MLNASVGVQRVIARVRRLATAPADAVPTGPRPVFRSIAARQRHLVTTLTAIVLGVASLGFGPISGRPAGDTGGTSGDGAAPRVAIGGGIDVGSSADRQDATGDVVAAYSNGFTALGGDIRFSPVSVDATANDGRETFRTYTVVVGDSLVGIAKRFDLSVPAVRWANRLSPSVLRIGQVLRIPAIDGVKWTVARNQPLARIGRATGLDPLEIMAANDLTTSKLVAGQVLILPATTDVPAKGKIRATTTANRSVRTLRTTSFKATTVRPSSSTRAPKTYTGGRFRWPTTSHTVSQPFHDGHYGIDIDGSTGDSIFAAAAGTVTFAGWKSNGGGYQVWIAHGSGLYTTYNHMASVSVGRGQQVGRGQHIGRMGASGNASGSHLHFEVWRGPIWNGGQRVNPRSYL